MKDKTNEDQVEIRPGRRNGGQKEGGEAGIDTGGPSPFKGKAKGGEGKRLWKKNSKVRG